MNVVQDELTAVQESGKCAFKNRQPLTANPFPFNSSQYIEWKRGWFDAQEEFLSEEI